MEFCVASRPNLLAACSGPPFSRVRRRRRRNVRLPYTPVKYFLRCVALRRLSSSLRASGLSYSIISYHIIYSEFPDRSAQPYRCLDKRLSLGSSRDRRPVVQAGRSQVCAAARRHDRMTHSPRARDLFLAVAGFRAADRLCACLIIDRHRSSHQPCRPLPSSALPPFSRLPPAVQLTRTRRNKEVASNTAEFLPLP